jgi:TonB family protein
MSARYCAWTALLLVSLACRKEAPPDDPGVGPSQPAAPPDQEAPVPLNGEAPIQYPPRLFDQRVEGEVVLRLFADSTGRLKAESSKVAESSGYPALDSAALAGAQRLRFAPARRRGLPVAAAFLQPIEFRHPQGQAIEGSPDATPH